MCVYMFNQFFLKYFDWGDIMYILLFKLYVGEYCFDRIINKIDY